MTTIIVCAIGFATLRAESPMWAGMLLLLVFALLGIGILGVVYRPGSGRAWWLGFTLFGWGYLSIVFSPWAAESIAPKLASTILLDSIYSKFGSPPIRSTEHGRKLESAIVFANSGKRDVAAKLVDDAFGSRGAMTSDEWTLLYELRDLLAPERRAILEKNQTDTINNHHILRVRPEDFVLAGHSLVTLLAASFGGLSARILYGGAGRRHEVSLAEIKGDKIKGTH